MAQTALTKLYESGDVFIRDDLSREYSSISAVVANAGSVPLYHLAGTPMVVTNPTLNTATAIAATEVQNLANSAINGYLIDYTAVPVGGMKCAIYTKFVGLVVNRDALPLVPPVVGGPAYLLSSHILNLDRLLIAHRSEPTRQMQQDK